MRYALHHKNTDQLLLRVDPKASARGTAPIKFSCRADLATLSRVWRSSVMELEQCVDTEVRAPAGRGMPFSAVWTRQYLLPHLLGSGHSSTWQDLPRPLPGGAAGGTGGGGAVGRLQNRRCTSAHAHESHFRGPSIGVASMND